MHATFEADESLQRLASAYALDVIDLVANDFGKTIDLSPREGLRVLPW